MNAIEKGAGKSVAVIGGGKPARPAANGVQIAMEKAKIFRND